LLCRCLLFYVRVTVLKLSEGHVNDMTGHIAHGAGAKILPASPRERMINATASTSSTFVVRCRRIFFVGPHGRGTNPKIPIESRRNRVFALGPINPLRPDRTIAPNVQFERLADQAGLNDFDGATETAGCASLV